VGRKKKFVVMKFQEYNVGRANAAAKQELFYEISE